MTTSYSVYYCSVVVGTHPQSHTSYLARTLLQPCPEFSLFSILNGLYQENKHCSNILLNKHTPMRFSHSSISGQFFSSKSGSVLARRSQNSIRTLPLAVHPQLIKIHTPKPVVLDHVWIQVSWGVQQYSHTEPTLHSPLLILVEVF